MDDAYTRDLMKAVGNILRDKFAAMERAVAAVRVTRCEQLAPGRALLVFGDGSTLTLELPHGAQGERGERGASGERGEVGERGVQGERGEPGERGAQGERGADGVGIAGVEQEEGTASFVLKFTNGQTAEVLLPEGEPGEPGLQGEPGRDRFIAAPRRIHDGESVAKNDLIAWGGGIVQAIRATTHDPDSDPSSYVCIVAGIAALSMVENLTSRTFDLTARLTDGSEQTFRARAMPRFMGDGPREGERVIRGDQFIRGDWLYSATADDADPANTEKGWARRFIRGKRGEDGPQGARGEPGVGVADVALDPSGVLTVRLTNGEEKYFDALHLIERAAA